LKPHPNSKEIKEELTQKAHRIMPNRLTRGTTLSILGKGWFVEQRHPLTVKETRLCLASLRQCMHLKEFSKDYTL
jgi:hypothetical protein